MVVERSLRPAPDAVAACLCCCLIGGDITGRAEWGQTDTAECTVSAPLAHLADAIEEWPPPPRRSALGFLLMGTRPAPG